MKNKKRRDGNESFQSCYFKKLQKEMDVHPTASGDVCHAVAGIVLPVYL